MLPEDVRQTFIRQLRFNAIDIPDADWLDIKEVREILTHEELNSLMNDVRSTLVENMSEYVSEWRMNEQGDSISDYYSPLIEALERYSREFDDRDIRKAVAEAKDEIEFRVSEAEEDSDEQDADELVYRSPTRTSETPNKSGSRSVFDDLDT
jgi:hypothetical protein